MVKLGCLSLENLEGEGVELQGVLDLGEEGVVVGESGEEEGEIAGKFGLNHLDHAGQFQLLL
jgi:hypothetical protein